MVRDGYQNYCGNQFLMYIMLNHHVVHYTLVKKKKTKKKKTKPIKRQRLAEWIKNILQLYMSIRDALTSYIMTYVS